MRERKILIAKEIDFEVNFVQFQPGLSLGIFLVRYGTEPHASRRWPQGFACPACGGGQHGRLRPGKVRLGHSCQPQVALTAGTLCVPPSCLGPRGSWPLTSAPRPSTGSSR